MSDDKLLKAVDELLALTSRVSQSPYQTSPTKLIEALRTARDALQPKEEPLTINDLTVEQRIASLDPTLLSQPELLDAMADHFRELYKAYADDTLAIHDERDAEVAKLEDKLKKVHGDLDFRRNSDAQLKELLCSKYQDLWPATAGVPSSIAVLVLNGLSEELVRLRPAVKLLRDLRRLDRTVQVCGTSMWAMAIGIEITTFLHSLPPDSSVHEASPGGSDSCEHTELKRGGHCPECGTTRLM